VLQDWTPLVASLATLAGVVLGYLLKRRGDAAAWEREDRYRWQADKRAAYGRFLGAADTYQQAVMARLHEISLYNAAAAARKAGLPVADREAPGRRPPADTLKLAHNELELLAPSTVTLYSASLIAELVSLDHSFDYQEDPWSQHVDPTSDEFIERERSVAARRGDFVKVARRDLGVADYATGSAGRWSAFWSRFRVSIARQRD
jgi:hypothetical protein